MGRLLEQELSYKTFISLKGFSLKLGRSTTWPATHTLKTPSAPQCLELKDLCLSKLCWHSTGSSCWGGMLGLMTRNNQWRGFVSGVQCQAQELDSTGALYSPPWTWQVSPKALPGTIQERMLFGVIVQHIQLSEMVNKGCFKL